jgi:exodeoxyribonuclease-3
MAASVSKEKEAARLERRRAALALRPTMSPSGPAPGRLRIATWNLNSLRARLAGVDRFLGRVLPDIVCLQETKAAELPAAATEVFDRHGYRVAHVGFGSYNGVAVAARHPLGDVRSAGAFDDEHLDREPRLLSCVVDCPEPVRVVSVYVPHGRAIGHWHYDYKLAFLEALGGLVAEWRAEGTHVVVAGDMNVAATDSDVFHPDAFVGATHVTAAEREALTRLFDSGLVDVDVARWGPRARRFTWWNHGIGYSRNLGMRLDVIAADPELAGRLDTTWTDHTERGCDRPSDHAALVADFHVPAGKPPATAPAGPVRSTRSALSDRGEAVHQVVGGEGARQVGGGAHAQGVAVDRVAAAVAQDDQGKPDVGQFGEE